VLSCLNVPASRALRQETGILRLRGALIRIVPVGGRARCLAVAWWRSTGPDILRHREQLRSEEIRPLAGVPKSVAFVELHCSQ
jgi:hypothetical protein